MQLRLMIALATVMSTLAGASVNAGTPPADAPPADAPPPRAATALKAGDVLDASNWELAKDLLPPEVLKHYREGEYANPIVDWPADQYTWPPDFMEGTKSNEGRYAIAGIKSSPKVVYDSRITGSAAATTKRGHV